MFLLLYIILMGPVYGKVDISGISNVHFFIFTPKNDDFSPNSSKMAKKFDFLTKKSNVFSNYNTASCLKKCLFKNFFQKCPIFMTQLQYCPLRSRYYLICMMFLREPTHQQALVELAKCSFLHFVASIDHVNATLVWDEVFLSLDNIF